MLLNLTTWEKRFFGIALLGIFVFSYVLSQDSFFDWESSSSQLKVIGTLTESTNDVRHKISKQYMWRPARSKIEIHQGDSLFTGAESESRVELLDGSEMIIKENSLVVFNMDNNQLNMNFSFGKLTVLTGDVKINGEDAPKNKPLFIQTGKVPKLAVVPPKVVKPVVVAKPTPTPQPTPVAAVTVATPTPAPTPVPLVAPQITSPDYNYTHTLEKTESGKWNRDRKFKISWAHPDTNSEFEMQVSADPEFKDQLSTLPAKGLSALTPELAAGTYFARVKERIADPQREVPWSNVYSFTIKELSFDAKLTAPVLLTTKLNYISTDKNLPVFRWKPVKGAGQYFLELSASSDFKDNRETSVKTTSYQWTHFAKGRFYFRVFAATEKGSRGPSSAVGEINVELKKPMITPLPPRTVLAKNENDPGEPQEFKVKWTGLAIADSYEVQMGTDSNYTNPRLYVSKTDSATVIAPKPGTYQWRVRPLDSKGKPLTDFSESSPITYIFKVALVTPTLIEPADNTTLFFQQTDSRVFWVEWRPVRQAETYTLEIATDEAFKNIVLTKNLTKNRHLIKDNLPLGNLYWHVKAEGDGKSSLYSATRRMNVFAGRPADNSAQEGQ